jgi:hypothetical protein
MNGYPLFACPRMYRIFDVVRLRFGDELVRAEECLLSNSQ